MSDYYVSAIDPATAKSIAEKFGFCLVRGVFSPEEMVSLERDLAMAHAEFGDRYPILPDLFMLPSLQWLLLDPRIQGFARALLGEQLVYYRETAANYEKAPGPITEKPFMEYHCDARGSRADLNGAPSAHDGTIYPAYRFGIYFRDYRDHSGGLKVAPGSHLRPYAYDRAYSVSDVVKNLPAVAHLFGSGVLTIPEPPIELYNVPSVPGDLVIFSLRTFHSAGALRFRDRPTFAALPSVELRLKEPASQLLAPPPPGSRNTIFFDFAAPTEPADFYIKWRALRADLPVLDTGYVAEAPLGMIVRNDRVIVALGERLAAAMSRGGTPSDEAKRIAADLAALCAVHVEFSDFHPLFDGAAFKTARARDPFAAACAAADQIVAAGKAVRAAAARHKPMAEAE